MPKNCGWCKSDKLKLDRDQEANSSDSELFSILNLPKNTGTDKQVYRGLWDDYGSRRRNEDGASGNAFAMNAGKESESSQLMRASDEAKEELKAERFQATDYKWVMEDLKAVTGQEVLSSGLKHNGSDSGNIPIRVKTTDWSNVREEVVAFIRNRRSQIFRFSSKEPRPQILNEAVEKGNFDSVVFHRHCAEKMLGAAAEEWWEEKCKLKGTDSKQLACMRRDWDVLRDHTYGTLEVYRREIERKSALTKLAWEVNDFEQFLIRGNEPWRTESFDYNDKSKGRVMSLEEKKDHYIQRMKKLVQERWNDQKIQMNFDAAQRYAAETPALTGIQEELIAWRGSDENSNEGLGLLHREHQSNTITGKNFVILGGSAYLTGFLIPMEVGWGSEEELAVLHSKAGLTASEADEERGEIQKLIRARKTWELLERLSTDTGFRAARDRFRDEIESRTLYGDEENERRASLAAQFTKGNKSLWNGFEQLMEKLKKVDEKWAEKTRKEESDGAKRVMEVLSRRDPDELIEVLSSVGVPPRKFLEAYEKRREARIRLASMAAKDDVQGGLH